MDNNKEIDVTIIEESQNYSGNNDKYRTLDEAINFDYDFSISDILSKAWSMVHGNKLTIILSLLLAGILGGIVGFIGEFIAGIFIAIPVISILISVIFSALSSIFIIGVFIIVLKLSNNERVDLINDFCQFKKYWLPIIILSIMMGIILTIGFALLIIPGIYLVVAYSLTYWILIVYPEASFWDILEASRKIVTRHWFKFFFLNLILGIILFVASIPLGIGLIWALPLFNFVYALLFKQIFEK